VRQVLEDASGALLALEVDPATDADTEIARVAGLVVVREVLQLRRPLPLDRVSDTRSRPFVPGSDEQAFLRVNNLAFAWHPDQSNLSLAELTARMAEPWFSPEGFLLHEDHGTVDGFCWTKIHPATDDGPAIGEIYVIGVDPSAHGRGLGTDMVLAGLDHLASRTIGVAMLHVEADNHAALAIYDRLGFHRHSSHQWWAIPGSPVPSARTAASTTDTETTP
jgi:mycothiol synthase